MTFALVQSSTVVSIELTQFPAHPSLSWIDVTNVTPKPLVGYAVSGTPGAWTFTAPPPPPVVALTPAQQMLANYSAFITAGLTVTSTGTPSLNGVFPLDQASIDDVVAEQQYVSMTGNFTNGGTVMQAWGHADGSVVLFAAEAQFTAYAKAVLVTVAAAKLAARTAGPMPSSSVTIP